MLPVTVTSRSSSDRFLTLRRARSARYLCDRAKLVEELQLTTPVHNRLRVVFLVGHDDETTRATIDYVCSACGIVPAAVLFDTARPALKARLRSLRRNIRREGVGYLFRRLAILVRGRTDRLVDGAVVSPAEVEALLRRAFPERSFSLEELGSRRGFPVREVGSLNGAEAIRVLRECEADLGIVLGTRILKPATFSVPRLGCINLHKGRVPDYRGMPPGFWELYDGADSAGVTVHFVDQGLDTGDIVLTATVPVEAGETPVSLSAKLDREGMATLARAVTALGEGAAPRTPQPKGGPAPRTRPTHAEVGQLRRKLPHWYVPGELRLIAKNLQYLLLYYSGAYGLMRWLHRRGGSRAAVILHHRVNDVSRDALTVDTATFAGQLLALTKLYRPISTSELVRRLQRREPIPPGSVAIHFDDCYRDVLVHAAPLLEAAGWSATAFINSGFVGTDRVFEHDAGNPHRFANLTAEEVRAWAERGFEIGAHTVNHVDLGTCPLPDARREAAECGVALQAMAGVPVRIFSFPFGLPRNIRPDTAECIREAGYNALFSAYGGFVSKDTDLFDIPRMGANYQLKPLFLLMELEKIAPSQWQLRGRREHAPTGDRAASAAASPSA